MREFVDKINNSPTSAGVVKDFEYNSAFTELENAVKPFLTLNGADNKQLSKSIDIASKALFYGDIGSANNVHLTRGATSDQIETLVDGITIFFSVANENTGASTLKLNHLPTKPMEFNGAALEAGILQVGTKYIAIYSSSSDVFNIDRIRGDGLGFGTDQFLVDKAAIRSEDVVYTNTTSRPIHVIITSDGGAREFKINDVKVLNVVDTVADQSMVTLVIPVDFTYELTSNSSVIHTWFEITSDTDVI